MENFINVTPINQSFEADARAASKSLSGGERKALSSVLGFTFKAIEHGDTQQLAKLLAGGFGAFSGPVLQRMAKVIVTVSDGINVSRNDTGEYRVTISKKVKRGFTDDWTKFQTACDDGKGINHPDLLPEGKAPKPFDMNKTAESAAKRAYKEKVERKEFLDAMAAAWDALAEKDAEKEKPLMDNANQGLRGVA